MFSLPVAMLSISLLVATAPKPGRDSRYTRYERARIIGSRALQVSMGAPVLVETNYGLEGPNPVEVSMKEFDEGLIPITVRRLVARERKRAFATAASGPAERGQRAKRERERET